MEGGTVAQSLAAARVELNPHQLDAALFAMRSPRSKGVVLADEVGLGKTIEAALVLAQRWWERRRRILLFMPASLPRIRRAGRSIARSDRLVGEAPRIYSRMRFISLDVVPECIGFQLKYIA